MNRKRWFVMLTVMVFTVSSSLCLAAIKIPIKPKIAPPRRSTLSPRQPHPSQRPMGSPRTGIIPAQSQRSNFGINTPTSEPQARPMPQVKIGATHPVERAQLQQAMQMPVYKEDQNMAVAQYHDERGHFTRNIEPVKFKPEYRAALTRVEIIPATYHYRRTLFYETYGWAPAPWVYGLYPRYGLYDTMFLAFMLDHIAEQEYAMMYYNHMQEEEFMMWRQEMDNLAMENGELSERLAMMDQQVASLQGTPRDPAYVPQDAQDVALSPDVIERLTKR